MEKDALYRIAAKHKSTPLNGEENAAFSNLKLLYLKQEA